MAVSVMKEKQNYNDEAESITSINCGVGKCVY